jgi:hypothetical protein
VLARLQGTRMTARRNAAFMVPHFNRRSSESGTESKS